MNNTVLITLPMWGVASIHLIAFCLMIFGLTASAMSFNRGNSVRGIFLLTLGFIALFGIYLTSIFIGIGPND